MPYISSKQYCLQNYIRFVFSKETTSNSWKLKQTHPTLVFFLNEEQIKKVKVQRLAAIYDR